MRGISVKSIGWLKLAAALLAALAMGYASSRVWGAERPHYAREYSASQEQAEAATALQLRALADQLAAGRIGLLSSHYRLDGRRGTYELKFEVRK